MEKILESLTVGDIGTNCWLYSPEDGLYNGKRSCYVIDPGDEAGIIISRLKELQWFPRYILLTHGHFDHLAALPELVEEFCNDRISAGSEAPAGSQPSSGNDALLQIGIHRLDALYLGANALDIHRESMIAVGGPPSYVEAIWKPLPEADLLFEEGDKAGSLAVLHLPGHSQGSAAFYDEKQGVLFSGDTLFQGNWGRTDLPGGNEAQLYQSLKRLLSMKQEIAVCPGHGPMTSIRDEQRILRYLRQENF